MQIQLEQLKGKHIFFFLQKLYKAIEVVYIFRILKKYQMVFDADISYFLSGFQLSHALKPIG